MMKHELLEKLEDISRIAYEQASSLHRDDPDFADGLFAISETIDKVLDNAY